MQRRGDALGGVERDREAHALPGQDRGRVHADRGAAVVDERAARVAGVERRVGLDHVVDQAARAACAASGRARSRCPPSPSPGSRRDCRARSRAARRAAPASPPSATGRARARRRAGARGRSPGRRRQRAPASGCRLRSVTRELARPCTTWLFVTTKPSGVSTKPEPPPSARRRRPAKRTSTCTTLGAARAMAETTACE